MKSLFTFATTLIMLVSVNSEAQQSATEIKFNNPLFMDIHYLPSGKVSFKDVAAAHAKDLRTQHQYNVQFIKYWVNESEGIVYCLSSAHDSASISKTHQEAHGLLPKTVLAVKEGQAAEPKANENYYIDIHEFGAGNVKAADVENVHQKDLAVQNKYGVHFINYWVDEKKGTVICLSQASDSSKVIQVHKEAHGLLPVKVERVLQGE